MITVHIVLCNIRVTIEIGILSQYHSHIISHSILLLLIISQYLQYYEAPACFGYISLV